MSQTPSSISIGGSQSTNLNVSPYYDDFDKFKNFYKVLFRPGFPIQARELTTLQSVLQNQVASVGSHLFKDGAMVIPGQVGWDNNVDCILLQSSFLGSEVENYRDSLYGATITGLTSGVKAEVINTISVIETERMLGVAEAAFRRGDYLLALDRLKQARLSFASETKGEFNLAYAVKNHPLQSLLIIFLSRTPFFSANKFSKLSSTGLLGWCVTK